MERRLQPHRRLLKILIGSNLYDSPDACIRELVQNAWDAVQLRKKIGDGRGGRIEIRFSSKEGWFEVVDDGIGMDMNMVENGFLQAGQDKLAILNEDLRTNQIGYFGIGILSIFLIADEIEVITKHSHPNSEVIQFRLPGIDEEVVFLDGATASIGTRIRVHPRKESTFKVSAVPEAIRKYARHVRGITITSVDDGTETSLEDIWSTDNLEHVELPSTSELIAGRVAIHPALRSPTGALSSEITVCNAGFLVEENAHDLLPVPALGLVGEIDLTPGVLTMGLSRERIQRDVRWDELGKLLQAYCVDFAIRELESGDLQATKDLDTEEIRRNLLLWYHYLPETEPFSRLYNIVEARVFKSVPFGVADRTRSSLSDLLEKTKTEKLFFRQIGEKSEKIERIEDEGLPIRVHQEVRDSIRVGALRANGFDVVELQSFQVSVRSGNGVQGHRIEERELVGKCLQSRGVELKNITEASESEIDLKSIERLPVLNDALSISSELRFASVPDSTRRVITDSMGAKYINLRNSDIQKILSAIPRAISNPLRRKLLETYLMIENFQLRQARVVLTELLLTDDLLPMASAETASFTQERVEALVGDLLRELT